MRCDKVYYWRSNVWNQREHTHVISAIWVQFTRVRPIAYLNLRLRNQQTGGGKLASLNCFQNRENLLILNKFLTKTKVIFRCSSVMCYYIWVRFGKSCHWNCVMSGKSGYFLLWFDFHVWKQCFVSDLFITPDFQIKSLKKSCGFGNKISKKW